MKPYFESGGIAIYHGDSREVLPHLPQADHVITDPPYSDVTHRGAMTNPDWAKSGGNAPHRLLDFDSIAFPDLTAIYQASAPKRWLVSFLDWRYMLPLEGWCAEQATPLRFVRHGIWVKPNGAPQFTGDRPGQGWEAIAVLHAKAGGRMRWRGGGHHAVWTYPKQNEAHKTAKPLPLVRRLVEQFTDPGDLILDPFMGGGAVLRAAKDLGRRAVGVEIDERHCERAARRLEQEVLDL